MGDRCRGHCCRGLRIPIGPDGLRENLRAAREGNWNADGHDRNGWPRIADIKTLTDVLIWTGRRVSFSKCDGARLWSHDWVYECRALKPDGDCAIYDNRPEMCSKYPYGKGCAEPGCEWTEQRRDTTT